MNIVQRLAERFWFVPAALCAVAVLVAETLITVDEGTSELDVPGWMSRLFYRVGESGSRDLLGAIATSSLAVAGTTFSITIAVLALTSSTYGPRLVRNFMADRGNQLVLGVYVATFLYSLLVLRSIRAIGAAPTDPEVFVPHLAVNVAVLLALANVGVLVYFIHHISDSIQIATLAAGVRADLRATVDRLYPEGVGHAEPRDGCPALPEVLLRDGAPITAGSSGYVQFIRDEALMKAARTHDVVLAMQVRPGEYVLADTTVARVHPPDRCGEDLERAVRRALKVTDARTPFQDVEFAVQQLTEIAVRALSPGTNDPYTAVNALDDLSVGLTLLASRPMPSPARVDDHGALRVHAPMVHVSTLVTSVLDTMRWYAPSAPLVMHHCLELAGRVGSRSRHPDLAAVLVTHVDLLRGAFARASHAAHDDRLFNDHADQVTRDIQAHADA